MKLHPVFRRALLVIAVLLLLFLAWEGISGGITQWSQSTRAAERVQLASQVVYGVFALSTIATAFMRSRWSPVAEAGFALGAAAAAGLATVVWGEQSILSGVLAGLGALAIAGVLIWMLRTGTR